MYQSRSGKTSEAEDYDAGLVSAEQQFAANLRTARKAAGLSQDQLAQRTGLHATEISRLERAVREPRLSTIVRLAKGLDVGPEELVRGLR